MRRRFRPDGPSLQAFLQRAALCLLPALSSLTQPASAQTLSDLLETAAPGQTIDLPDGLVTGRADIAETRTLIGATDTTLRAPDDDAILVVLPGAAVSVSGVTLKREGRTAYAIYVDGGTLTLEDCRIEGAFEVAIYVGSGGLSVRNCTIEAGTFGIEAAIGANIQLQDVRLSGQADTAISVNGAALSMTDVSVSDAGSNGVVVVAPSDFRADGLTILGTPANGLWIEGSAVSTIRRLVVDVAGQGAILIGGDQVSIDAFAVRGANGGLHAENLSAGLHLSLGKIEAGPGSTAAALSGLGGLTLDDIAVIGGETGLYLTGDLSGAAFSNLLLHSQTGTGLFFDGTRAANPITVQGLRAIATRAGIAAYFRDAGQVTFSESALIATGPTVFGREGWSEPSFRDSTLIAAPDPPVRETVFDPGPDGTPAFVADGALWWASDPAILPGSRTMTLAGLVDALPPASDLQAPALALALGRDFAPYDLALALDYVLPPAGPPVASKDQTTISLAPPEPGWLWDPNAIHIILTGPDGSPIDLWPANFPVDLAAGRYSLVLDGQSAGSVTLGPDNPTLSLPLPDAPFYAWRDEQGQKWRGPALYLRPKAELSALLAGFRPLRIGEYWGYAPQFAPRAGADRAFAAEFIATARDRIPAILADLVALRAAEDWPAFNQRWLEADITLDIMGAFGSLDDAAWLLALPVPEGADIPQIETAALIEMRLGKLADGATIAQARSRAATGLPTDEQALEDLRRLVRALGRSGLPEGTALLAEFARALPEPQPMNAPDPTGVIELSRLSPGRSGDVPDRYLDRFQSYLAAYLDDDLPADAVAPIYSDHWNAAIAALAHEALAAPPGTVPRRLPIPPNAAIGSSSWAFADPLTLMRGPLGKIGPANPDALSGWTYRFQDYICTALAYRDPVARASLLSGLRDVTADAVALWATPEESRSDPALLSAQFDNAAFALDIMLGECVLSNAVLNSFGRDAAGEEAALFENLGFEPLWWLRRPRTEAALTAFANGEDYPSLSGHSALPMAEVKAALALGNAADPNLQVAFLARHQLLSDAYQGSFDFLTFGSEHRQFRLRSDNGDGSITIAGHLDILPILSNDRLILAIRHQIETPDYGGLAAMITEPDRAPYEADHRRLMFETLTLDRAGAETPMEFAGTSASGVHFFTAPLDEGLSDLVLHLGMRFVDTTWQIDVTLWDGNLAYGERLRSPAPPKGAP